MVKKMATSVLLISTLIISTFIATVPNPASATIFRDGTNWWTTTELLGYYWEVLDEQAILCDGDTVCMQQYHENNMIEVDKYRALANLIRAQFIITAVNPKAETIKVLFFDQNAYHKIMGSRTETTLLKSFYVAWFDNWQGQIFDFDYTQFASGAVEGLHTVYDSIASSLNVADFPTWQEVEISVPGSNLIFNTSGKIDFTVFGESGYSSQGFSDYSSCLKDPNYQEGDECRIITTRGKGISYAPFRVEETREPVAPTTEEPIEDKTSDSIDNKIKTPKAPETGAQVYPGTAYNREIETPWWITALAISGAGLLIWWFLPNRYHSRQNSQKSSKKSIKKS